MLWVAGGWLFVGILMAGPVLGRGALFHLDRTLVPDPPFPWGTFGIGVEIPRDAPLSAILWFLGAVFGHVTTGKALMVCAIAGSGVTMHHFARRFMGPFVAIAAAALYATNPFLLTRLFVGHQGIWVAMALLPVALVLMLAPRRPVRDVFLGTAVLCVSGSYGGILALLVVLAAVRRADGVRAAALRVGACVAASLVWLLPGFAVMLEGPALASSAQFPAGTASIGEIPALFAGHGFWLETFEVGIPREWIVGLIGCALLALGVLGSPSLPPWCRRPMERLAVLALLISAAPGIPLLDSAFDALTSTGLGAPFREPQRYLVLYLAWLAVAAPLGALRVAARWPAARETAIAVPLAAALALSSYGWWGLGGHLTPTPIPASWAEARTIVRDGGGTTMALPWTRYMTLRFAEASRSLNPIPKYFGTDVLVSSDLKIGGESRERVDGREAAADQIAREIESGETASTIESLNTLGVRWVVLLHEGAYQRFLPGLLSLDLEPVLVTPEIELYEVPGWTATAVTVGGAPVDVPAAPGLVARIDEPGAFTWYRSHQTGWLRGFEPTTSVGPGLDAVPPGGGWLWFAPGWVVLIADVALVGLVCAAMISRSKDRRVRMSE
jgi:hypothetical protein